MNESILALMKRIKENVDKIDPLDASKEEENYELKRQSSNLLLLAIDKIESDIGDKDGQTRD